MILRRVIEHFRKQEWTAIAIDFVIVVAGVFVGLQVSNWNAARADRAMEHEILAAIAEDLRVERAELKQGAEGAIDSIGAANYALRAIGEAGLSALAQRRIAAGEAVTLPEITDPDVEQRQWLWARSVASFYPTGSAVAFAALTNTGRLGIVTDPELVRALQNYRQRWRGLDETHAGTMRPLRNDALSVGARYGFSLLTALPEQGMLQKLREHAELRAMLQNHIVFKTRHYELIADLDRDAAALLEAIESKLAP